ncbi:hypothetical protein [Microvirga lotononidis]|uniref:hypothetical protein n=1 Tax=Microvirga lotononidis TaxID=864069 RepID=UPI0003150F8A|nr:hypothetical protein [Microvirga lotononidis]WQO31234.1 hypothetical protein U0023_33585 [Microvirga lotononidis]
MGCGLTGGLLILEATISGLLKAADMALNSGGEATIIRNEAQDGCCIAGTLWTDPLAHVAPSFRRLLLIDEAHTYGGASEPG